MFGDCTTVRHKGKEFSREERPDSRLISTDTAGMAFSSPIGCSIPSSAECLRCHVCTKPPAHARRSPFHRTRLRQPLSPRSRGTIDMSVAPVVVDKLREKIEELAGDERGILGLDSELREEIHACIEEAESVSPTPAPASMNAIAAGGSWRLLYTTLTILGRRRVKLAIGTKSKPGFVKLGDLYQTVDPDRLESQNIVVFKMALGGSGTFTISAKYRSESDTRVLVETTSTALEPAKLEELLGDNISLLTQIFDPTGHLDITYLDETMRIGRDDKGNIFVLEKCEYEAP